MKITIVLPVFNEEKKVGEVLKDLLKFNFPVVVIDDGSTDQTSKIIDLYKKKSRKLQIIRHKINLGKGAAIKTGCIVAFNNGADAIIMMDGDGQHRVSDLPKFIEALKKEKFDIIFGARLLNSKVPYIRLLGNKMASGLVAFLFGVYVSDLVCGFRAFTKKTFKKINLSSQGYGVEAEMVILAGRHKLTSCEIPVETVYYDKFKGVTVLDALMIFVDVLRWRINL